MAVVTAREATPRTALEVESVETERYWLVEHFEGDGSGDSTGFYHTGFTDISGNSRATTNQLEARRYHDRVTAESVAARLGSTLSGTWKVAEYRLRSDHAALKQFLIDTMQEGTPTEQAVARTAFKLLTGAQRKQ
jgi:hypothetical protein